MTRKQILMTIVWAIVVGLPAWLIAKNTGIRIIAPLGAAVGAAYAFVRYKKQ